MSVLDKIRRAIGGTDNGEHEASHDAPAPGGGGDGQPHTDGLSKSQAEDTPSKGKRRGCC